MKYLVTIALLLLISSCKEKKDTNTNTEVIKTTPEPSKQIENLIKWKENWKVGQGSMDNFKSFGNEQESQRILGLDIDSNETVLWECVADTTTNWDGGFMSNTGNIDPSKPYLFIAWVKKPLNNSARIYYAFDSVEEVTGEAVRNANFIGAGSKLTNLDSWYTLVGYIYPENYKDNIEADVYSGLYLNGEKIQEGRDFKWKPRTKSANYRVVQVDSKISGENLLICNPQLYVVDGTEPKLYKLL